MKKYITLFAACMAMICASCDNDDSTQEPTFSLETPEGKNPTLISIDVGGYSKQFTIKSNATWRIEKPQTDSWLTVQPQTGQGNGAITLSAPANEQTTPLQTTLTFFVDNKEFHKLTIKQDPKIPFLTVEPSVPEMISATGGDFVLTVTTNMKAWEYAITGENSGWLTEKTKDATGITFTAAKNILDTEQTATITLSVSGYPDVKQVVAVKQGAKRPPYLRVTPETPANIAGGGGDLTLTIDTNLDQWEYAITGENSGWLTEKAKNETGITFTATRSTVNTEQTATVTFTSADDPNVQQVVVIKQDPQEAPFMFITPEEPDPISAVGGDLTLSITTNVNDWTYTIKGDNSGWLTEKSKNAISVTLKATGNLTSAEQTAIVEFTTPTAPNLTQQIVVKQNGFVADLLDVVFQSDGTAIDASPMNNTIATIAGEAMTTYQNSTYNRYFARFDRTPGTVIESGYYKMDYVRNEEFKSALADGHSMEILLMFNSEPLIGSEVKMFSSMQGGGTGFLLARETGEFTFLPNLSQGGWQWVRSGVVPEKDKFYHVVGVWDKSKQEACIYVNGELKGSIAAVGDFKFPNAENCYWFCVGGDASPTSAENGWRGDIGIARIYGDPLSAEQVAKLWEEVAPK